jgi:hypothetical protein
MSDRTGAPVPGWVPAARLATILAGVAIFVYGLWLYNFGPPTKAFVLLGLGIVLWGIYALHGRVAHWGQAAEPAWRPYPLAEPRPPAAGQPASTEARFVPDPLWGFQKLSAPSLMLILFGAPLVAIGVADKGWVTTGVGVALLVVALWTNPRAQRGIWHGTCPHCGEPLSAFKHARQFECPQCERQVLLQDGRYHAV